MSKFLAYIKTYAFRKAMLIAVSGTLAFLMIAFYSLQLYTHHGESISVPIFEGLPVNRAIQMAESMGFRYQIDSVYQMDKPPGLVIEQDPDPNTLVKNNRTIYLTIITTRAPKTNFPDIMGMTFLEACATLANYDLKLGDTSYQPDVSKDRVLEAKLAGKAITKGQELPKGSSIELVLGNGMGASWVELPNLKGLTLSEAIFSLRGASLNLGNVSYQGVIIDSTNARIVEQAPAPSDTLTEVAIGTRVNVTLNNR